MNSFVSFEESTPKALDKKLQTLNLLIPYVSKSSAKEKRPIASV